MKQHRRQHASGSRRVGIVGIVLVLCFAAAGVANYVRPLPVIAATQTPLNANPIAATPFNWPSQGQAAIGAQGFGLLASSGSETPLPTASVAKIITSLAILEEKPLTLNQQGPGLTITPNDVAIFQKYAGEDGSVVPVTVGEQLTEYQMLEAMLLPSANNIADSAATWVFGSLPNYVTYANQMLQRLGLTHTTVSDDASGFLPNTTSTATDLVKLGEAALQNPVIAQIVNQPQADLPVAGTVHNVDTMLGVDGIIGVKTGNTDQAGGCFLFAATYAPVPNRSVTIVGAVMGASDLGSALQESLPLLTTARKNFSVQTFATAGQTVGTYKTAWGESAPIISSSDVTAVVWNGTPVNPITSIKDVGSSANKNTTVGAISVHAGNTTSSHPLVLGKAITAPSWSWRLFRNPF